MNKSLLEVHFPGGKKVDAAMGKFVVHTDQNAAYGGEGSAPSPFQLFLSSLATCAGIYALNFCETRKIPVDGMSLNLEGTWDEEKKKYTKLAMNLRLPEGFSEKYREAIIRAMDQCAVKKHIMDPPEFEVTASPASEAERRHEAA